METKPKALILRAPGTNCDVETAYAFGLAGAEPTCVHVNRVIENPRLLAAVQIFCIPGGFSYGDDIAAGRILAGQLRDALGDALHAFRDRGNCILGICNGFQVLLQTGLLIPDNYGAAATATLTRNDTGHYEDRWVTLRVASETSVFLTGVQHMDLPVAHAEGKFVVSEARLLDQLRARGQLALTYANPDSLDDKNVAYPANPNGSLGNVAALADETGRVFGLMPHPERFVHRTQHPRWTREALPEAGHGLLLFQNVVQYFTTARQVSSA